MDAHLIVGRIGDQLRRLRCGVGRGVGRGDGDTRPRCTPPGLGKARWRQRVATATAASPFILHDIYFKMQRRRVARTRRHITRTTRDSNIRLERQLEYDSRATRGPSPYIFRGPRCCGGARQTSLAQRPRNQCAGLVRASARRAATLPPPIRPLFARHSVSSARQTPILQTFPTTLQSTNGFPNPHARSL